MSTDRGDGDSAERPSDAAVPMSNSGRAERL
jgi:hypothetical protein